MKTIIALIAAAILIFVLLRWRLAKRHTTFGSAGWLPAWTASGKGLFRKGGLIAGDWITGLPAQYKGSGHALTVAPTGGGKGTAAIIPNLLRHPWIFMLDPGGENTAVASKAWRDKGYHFICLNPWKMHAGAPWSLPSHAINPLDILDPGSKSFASDADLLADMIVARTGSETGNTAYFKDEAQSGIRAFLIHIVTAEPPSERNLLTLRKYVCAQAVEWEALLEAMKRNPAANGLIAREAAQLERREVQSPGEFSAIVSTIKQDTNFVEDPVMQQALCGNGADIEGAAHAPSPRQKVLDEALVPLLRFPTGRLPVTCEARLTAAVEQSAAVPPAFALQKLLAVNVPTCGSVSAPPLASAAHAHIVPLNFRISLVAQT